MSGQRLRLVHAIHDFLPRHRAGAEIYAFDLCRELGQRLDVTVVTADVDPSRRHGDVTWRMHEGVPVVEIVNNWVCGSFQETYRPPLISNRLRHVLDVLQPDVLHVHSLLNLSFDLPADAQARGIPVVATLHDYSLVCPSGGQRIHRAEHHVCHDIDVTRCARCFRESPFYLQMSVGNATRRVGGAEAVRWLGRTLLRTTPGIAARVASATRAVAGPPVSPDDVRTRLARAHDVLDTIDLLVAPSESIADEFARMGVDRSKMRVSDYGLSAVASHRRARPAGLPLRLGFVGTVVWHKGLHVAIDALRELPTGSGELHIFGDPNVFPDYTSDLRVRSAGLPVSFRGPFERDRVAEVFSEIDLLIVPSLWLENSPLVIHEAWMDGVPVVGSRIGGIAELVQDNWNGALFEPGDPHALAMALRHFIDEPARIAQFAARLPAAKTISQNAREWEDTYAEVLAARGRQVGALA